MEILQVIAKAAETLTRGTPMDEKMTNQTIELKRQERKSTPTPAEGSLGMTSLLQKFLNSIPREGEGKADGETGANVGAQVRK